VKQNGSTFSIRGTDYKPTLLFDIFVIVTISVQAYLYFKYEGQPLVIMTAFNLLNIEFCVIGRYVYSAGLQAMDAFRVKPWMQVIEKDKYGADKKPKSVFFDYHVTGFWDVGLGFVLFIVLVITQTLLRPIKLNVSALDAFLFYVFSAPAEEVFFRFFFTAAPIIVGVKIIEKIENKCPGEQITAWKEVALKTVVAIITGLTFGLAHAAKYVSGELLAVVVNGLELSFFYAFTKRIDIVLIAHLLVNTSFGIQFIMGAV
jgi:membrane protease YdiL (CAAX protease family)